MKDVWRLLCNSTWSARQELSWKLSCGSCVMRSLSWSNIVNVTSCSCVVYVTRKQLPCSQTLTSRSVVNSSFSFFFRLLPTGLIVDRAFFIATHLAWNWLQTDVRLVHSMASFTRKLNSTLWFVYTQRNALMSYCRGCMTKWVEMFFVTVSLYGNAAITDCLW